MNRSLTSMVPEQAGQRSWWIVRSDLGTYSAEQTRGSVRAVCRLRLAKRPKWRMRTRPWAARGAESGAGTHGGNGHDLLLAAMGIVSPAEDTRSFSKAHEPMVGDGDAMGVARQVVENMFGAAEGRLGVDDPVLLAQLPEKWLNAPGAASCSSELWN